KGAVDRRDARLGAWALRARRARARRRDGAPDARAGPQARGRSPHGGEQGERAPVRALTFVTGVTRSCTTGRGDRPLPVQDRALRVGLRLAAREDGMSEERFHQLFVLNVALQLFDGIATWHGVCDFGEGNPLLASFMAYLGVGLTVLLFKAK